MNCFTNKFDNEKFKEKMDKFKQDREKEKA